MPTYEYKCTECDERFEIEQSIHDDALTTLEGCEVDSSGDHRLKKVFAAPGIAFKGSGFYRNDSRSGSSSSSSSSTSGSSSGSTSTTSSTDSTKASSSNGSSSSSGSNGADSGSSATKATTSSSSD